MEAAITCMRLLHLVIFLCVHVSHSQPVYDCAAVWPHASEHCALGLNSYEHFWPSAVPDAYGSSAAVVPAVWLHCISGKHARMCFAAIHEEKLLYFLIKGRTSMVSV